MNCTFGLLEGYLQINFLGFLTCFPLSPISLHSSRNPRYINNEMKIENPDLALQNIHSHLVSLFPHTFSALAVSPQLCSLSLSSVTFFSLLLSAFSFLLNRSLSHLLFSGAISSNFLRFLKVFGKFLCDFCEIFQFKFLVSKWSSYFAIFLCEVEFLFCNFPVSCSPSLPFCDFPVKI